MERTVKPVAHKKFHFVYQTKNLINGKTYVGVRSTNNINDGYIGNGIRSQSDSKHSKTAFAYAVAKYGISNFKREILSFYDSSDEAYKEEEFIVCESWIKSDNNYNTCLGGRFTVMSSEGKERLAKRMRENNPMKNPDVAMRVGKIVSEKMKGRKFSDESKVKMSNASKEYCSTKVTDLKTGITYDSMRKCAESVNHSRTYIKDNENIRFIFTSCGS
jgi:hypothetical protein